jgi:hypothetical protein
LNNKGVPEFLLKLVYRGGRIDDVVRGMVLFDEITQDNIN